MDNPDLISFFFHLGKYELVVDLLRYEILFDNGGFAIDADTYCLRSLPEQLLTFDGFSCFESKVMAPGLTSNGYLASRPCAQLLDNIIRSISADPLVRSLPGLLTLGPGRLTRI